MKAGAKRLKDRKKTKVEEEAGNPFAEKDLLKPCKAKKNETKEERTRSDFCAKAKRQLLRQQEKGGGREEERRGIGEKRQDEPR